jgi:hypothetical protein
VYDVVASPERWADFLPHTSELKVAPAPGGARRLDWTLKTAILTVRFSALMHAWPLARTHLVATGGDIKVGAWGWELRELAADRTFAVYYDSSDLHDAGFLFRKLLASDPSFAHALNVALMLSMTMAVKSRAESAP